jgi:hypothetical protein
MELMLVATGAILLPFDALRVQALVLHGEVVAVLTLAASENDLFARHLNPFLKVLSVRVGALSVIQQPGLLDHCSDARSALVNELVNDRRTG